MRLRDLRVGDVTAALMTHAVEPKPTLIVEQLVDGARRAAVRAVEEQHLEVALRHPGHLRLAGRERSSGSVKRGTVRPQPYSGCTSTVSKTRPWGDGRLAGGGGGGARARDVGLAARRWQARRPVARRCQQKLGQESDEA